MKKPNRFDENEPLLETGELLPDSWRLPPAPEGLRDDLLAQTSAAVRAKARHTRFMLAGAVAAAYGAGLVTAFLALGGVRDDREHAPVVSNLTHQVTMEAPEPELPAASYDMLSDPEQFALLLARSPVEEQIGLLKTAGDRYLNEFGNVEQALNHYRRLLSIEPLEDGTRTSFDDSWLLRALKQARLQEEHHANANS